eukprot:TRINITY_DN36370_c0_g2_i1.p1 TRINITY_DN36370_c0_g2~~TRINITY_DN36370_c0_g2_i1.p1  ORF type:complete len:763 (-),score=157.25 TRINITY_DN36370_c0_g2_i1:31-2319(-)
MGALQRSPASGQGGGHFCETSADVVAALGALAECCSHLSSEPLKRDVGSATEQLLGHVEGCCRKVIQELVAALKQPGCAALAYDKIWALRHVGKQSEVTRHWMQDANAMAAIAEVMAAHPEHRQLLEEGTWLAYVLKDVDGFVELLKLGKAMQRGSAGAMAVQQAAAWATFQLACKQIDFGKVGPAEWPQANELVILLLDAMRLHPTPTADLLWGCCKALKMLIEEQPVRGSHFVEQGGAEALLAALGRSQTLGEMGQDVLVAGMRLMTALVEGNSSVALRLRSMGALDSLVAYGLSLPGRVLDETMWTLGQVGGPLAVLRVMSRPEGSGGNALGSGLRTLAKLTWEPVEDGLLEQFPQVVQELLQLSKLVVVERAEELVFVVQALGGALKVCAPHANPGSVAFMDAGVGLLHDALRPGRQEAVSQASCACIGSIAECAPAWRSPLQATLPDLALRLRSMGDSKENCDNLRELLWALGSIAGVPAVLEEMRQQPHASGVQFASISAIVDVLERDEGWCPSVSSNSVPPGGLADAVGSVAASMKLHRAVQTVQSTGCKAVALLCQSLPQEVDVPQEGLDAILAALRRHPNEYKVVNSACAALRSFLEPRAASQESLAVVARTATALCSLEGAVPAMRRILKDFCVGGDKDILENCFFVVGLLEGVPSMLEAISEKDGLLNRRLAGLQVLCDLARSFRHLLAPHAKHAAFIAGVIVQEALSEASKESSSCLGVRSRQGREGELGQEVAELRRRAEILEGLLSGL